LFRYQAPFFTNEHGKVMDINGNVDAENRNVEMINKHGRINQQWDLVYVDEHPDEPTAG
jgi:peroxiredoxin